MADSILCLFRSHQNIQTAYALNLIRHLSKIVCPLSGHRVRRQRAEQGNALVDIFEPVRIANIACNLFLQNRGRWKLLSNTIGPLNLPGCRLRKPNQRRQQHDDHDGRRQHLNKRKAAPRLNRTSLHRFHRDAPPERGGSTNDTKSVETKTR